MKKFSALLLGAAAVFQLTSCSTKFNIAAPYKSVTVVYGLLDMADTAHYVRIEKAFLSQTISAATMAQSSDSSFYSQLNVSIKAVNSIGGIDLNMPLTRVDLNQEGYQKTGGVFFTGPSYAYKFKATLDPHDTYWLIVSNPATGEVDSAQSPVINDIDHSVFTIPPYDNFNPSNPDWGIEFKNIGINNPTESFSPAVQGTYSLPGSTTDQQPAIYQAVFRLRWENITDNNVVHDSADLALLPSGTTTLPAYSFTTSNFSMYQFILNSMGQAGAGESRRLDSCDLIVYAGSSILATYQRVSDAAGTGLTANEIEPNYTNIVGKSALGLFTARGTRSIRVRISLYTIDSLIRSSQTAGQYLSGTNIVGTTY